MDSIEVGSIWYSSDRQSSFLRSGHFLRNRSSPLLESTEYNELSFHRDTRSQKMVTLFIRRKQSTEPNDSEYRRKEIDQSLPRQNV